MKKLLLLMCSVLLTWTAAIAQDDGYCKLRAKRASSTQRTFSKFVVTGATVDGQPKTYTFNIPSEDLDSVYQDLTKNPIECTQGDVINVTVSSTSAWMYFFLYADYNQDKEFSVLDEKVSDPNLDNPRGNMPAFTIPLTAKAGKTRMRFLSAWQTQISGENAYNPCGDAEDMGPHNGLMADFTMLIHAKNTKGLITLSAMQHGIVQLANAAGNVKSGDSVALGTKVALKPVPDSGYKLQQILVNGSAFTGDSLEVNQDMTISASFIPNEAFSLHFSTFRNGKIKAVLADDATGNALADNASVSKGATVRVTYLPNEHFLLETALVNGENVKANVKDSTYTFTMSGDVTLGATFMQDPAYVTYCTPKQSGNMAPDAYIESAKVSSKLNAVDYSSSAVNFYKTIGTVFATQGDTVTAHFVAHSAGEYSESVVHEDLRYTVVAMFIDRNQDGDFASDESERVAGKLSNEGLQNVGGNMASMDVTKKIAVPQNVKGKIRVRFIWSNAWLGDPLQKACGPVSNEVIDFDIDVKAASYAVMLQQPKAEEGAFKVMKGETEVKSGDHFGAGVTLNVVPTIASSEYELRSVLVNNKPIKGTSFVLTDSSVVSLDIIKGRVINFSSEGLGKVVVLNQKETVANNAVLVKGTALVIKAVPEAGQYVKSVSVNGMDKTVASASATGFAAKLDSDFTVKAVFAPKKFKVVSNIVTTFGSLSVMSNGVTVASGDSVTYGSEVSFTITPHAQSFVKKLLVNGVDRTAELLPEGKASFTLTVTDTLNVNVMMDAKKYHLTCNQPLYGKLVITDNAGKQYHNGDEVPLNTLLTVSMTADEKGKLDSLFINDGTGEALYQVGSEVDQEGQLYITDFTVTGDVSVRVVFAKTTAVNSASASSVHAYINATGSIVVEGLTAGDKVMISNMKGQTSSSFIATSSKAILSMPATRSSYIVKVVGVKGTFVKKLSK